MTTSKVSQTDAWKKDPTKMISIRGAREHNLKGVDIDLPRDKLIVMTGLSGSGNLRSPSIRFMRRASAATWKACPPMRASSWR
ncbi:hypothetical protein ACFQEX_13135 [Roseibium salinum]|uniref:hypothetical protein n=1 Tax=Roseibium salinum TaxID=1604349 RepID=UPI00361872C7